MSDATRDDDRLRGSGWLRQLGASAPEKVTSLLRRPRGEGASRDPASSDPSVRTSDAPKKDWAEEAALAEAQVAAAGAKAAASAYARLGQARRMSGDLAGAHAAVQAGIAHRGETGLLLREAAEVAMLRTRWRDAATFWERAIALDGEKTTANRFARWATALCNMNAYDAAEAALRRGLALFPSDPKLTNELADAQWLKRAAASKIAMAPNASLTIDDVCSAFWEIERDLSLVDWRANGVAPWPLLRMPLYYGVTQKVGLYDAPHPTLKAQVESTRDWTAAVEAEWAPIERAYYAGEPPIAHRSAVLMATRKIDGSEPYTAAIRSELGENLYLLDGSADPCSSAVFPFHAYKEYFRLRYRRRDEIARLSAEAQDVCVEIWRRMNAALGIDIGNLAKTCRTRLMDFDAIARGFEIFFSQRPIDTLYLTNAYGSTNRAIVHSARTTGARVVELQHGFISRYHLGYSWPGRPEVPYSPDELWCFGEYWPETTPLPKHTRHRVIGAPYVKELARQAAGAARDEKLVVFTSQGVIGRKLFNIAVEVARRRPDKRFIYRLHPNEGLEDYQALLAAIQNPPPNLELSHRNPNIFALLATSAIQVGAFSTTLFEGMSLGARTIVIEMPGSEYMRPAVERGDALMVRTPEELAAKLDLAPLCADPQTYYAEPLPRLL